MNSEQRLGDTKNKAFPNGPAKSEIYKVISEAIENRASI